VFFKDGKVVGVLPTGRHTLQTQNIPFFVEHRRQVHGGQRLHLRDLLREAPPLRGIPFGGPVESMEDPILGRVRHARRIFGEFSLIVTDPMALRRRATHGQAAQSADNDQILHWIKGRFINSVGTVLTELCEAEHKSVLSVINNKERLAQAFIQRAPSLNDIGVRILEMGRIDPNIPEEHMAELREAVKELAVAQREVRKKQIAVAGAAAEAQAAQFGLDQKYGQDARYVQNLAGNWQSYASGQAVMGAGQGMAQHGVDGGGMAGAAVQMAMGVGMAGSMMNQMGQAGGAAQQQPPPPQFSPGGRPRHLRRVQDAAAWREVLRRVRRGAGTAQEVLHRVRPGGDPGGEVLRAVWHVVRRARGVRRLISTTPRAIARG
jgi:hypothetical protein